MAWHDSPDPRCPECGEKIASTATYCMHCDADLDVAAGTGESDGSPDQDSVGGDENVSGDMQAYGGDEADDVDAAREAMTATASQSSSSTSMDAARGDRHGIESLAHDLTSFLWTDVPDPEGIAKSEFTAPLWMRLPVGVVAGIFVYIFFLIYIAVLLNPLPDFITGLLALAGFFGIMTWLVRKPFPSDILGDASYGLAGMLYSVPIVYVLVTAARYVLGLSQMGPGAVVVTAIISFVTWIPATILLVIGYVGNRYARRKLDTKTRELANSKTA